MNTPQVAIYARVSSDQQAEAQTIASQVAALRERVTADGAVVPEAIRAIQFSSSIPMRASACAGWAANRRQAAAMLVSPAHRSSPITVLRSAAMIWGVLPQRTCERSSSNVTSRTQCDLFSICQ